MRPHARALTASPVAALALSAGLVLAALPLLGATPAAAQAASTISGRVTDFSGGGLSGVCVAASTPGSAEPGPEATTDAAGDYVLAGLDAGDYVVSFNACEDRRPGYAPQYFDNAPSVTEATVVAVDGTSPRADVNAMLDPTGNIGGTITDEDTGEPLEGACVVTIGDTEFAFGEAESGADGTYLVEDLPAGDYLVVFGDCTEPYLHLSELFDDAQDPEQEPTPVGVPAGGTSWEVDAALEEGGALQGTVTALHTGREQPLVCVGAVLPGSEDPAVVAITGFTPAEEPAETPGQYTVGGVRAGTYDLALNPAVCFDDGYDESWYDGADDRADADPVTVEQGQVSGGFDAVVVPRPSTSFACFPELGGEQFSDVPPGNLHAESISCLAGYEVATGRADGSYGPYEQVRRDQMAGFVARTLEALDTPLPAAPADAFDDDNGNTHELAINQLAELGVVDGKAARRYAPADAVSRGQMTAYLVRAYEAATGFTLRAPDDRFSDDDGTTHEASTNKAATAGFAAGTGATTFDAGVPVHRDQMASFLARLIDRTQRDTFSVTDAEPAAVGGSGASAAAGAGAARPGPAAGPLRRLAADAAQARG